VERATPGRRAAPAAAEAQGPPAPVAVVASPARSRAPRRGPGRGPSLRRTPGTSPLLPRRRPPLRRPPGGAASATPGHWGRTGAACPAAPADERGRPDRARSGPMLPARRAPSPPPGQWPPWTGAPRVRGTEPRWGRRGASPGTAPSQPKVI